MADKNLGLGRKISTVVYGRKVTLEQIAGYNALGTVYVMSWGEHRLNGWGYGRGHTEAKESFLDEKVFEKMARDYIETLARFDKSMIKSRP